MLELKISLPRDKGVLTAVMKRTLAMYHYEEPAIFLREDWAHRAAYDPNRDNPNRWWNNGRGLPPRIGG